MVSMAWIAVDLLASDVREDALGVPRILRNQCLRVCKRRRRSRSCRFVIESEAPAKTERTHERLARVCRQRFWRNIELTFDQIGGDAIDRPTVELGLAHRAFPYMHDRNNDSCLTRPFQ